MQSNLFAFNVSKEVNIEAKSSLVSVDYDVMEQVSVWKGEANIIVATTYRYICTNLSSTNYVCQTPGANGSACQTTFVQGYPTAYTCDVQTD